MMNEKKTELNNCTNIKGILMLSIIFYHSMVIFASSSWFRIPGKSSVIFKILAQFLNSFHIYAFVFISGYIYYYIKYEKGGYNNKLSFMWNKFKRLIIPYIFVSAIWAIPIYVYFFRPKRDEIVAKFLFGNSPEQLWFLLMLFWVFLIYNFIFEWIQKNYILGTIMILILCFVGMIWDFTIDYFQFFKALQFILFFHMGCSWRNSKYEKKREPFKQISTIKIVILQLALFFVTLYISEMNISMFTKILNLLLTVLLHAFNAWASFIVLQRFICNNKLENNKILSFVSQNGMCMFLFHQQIIYCILANIMDYIQEPVVLVVITFVLAGSITLAISCILSKYKITRFLIGEKVKS